MTTHRIRAWPEAFAPILSGERPFDLRPNDLKFKPGDKLILEEYEPFKEGSNKFTGRKCEGMVTYVLEGIGGATKEPLLGLARGYAVLGLTIEGT